MTGDLNECPSCGRSCSGNNPPFRCLKCGWTSEPAVLQGVPDPLAPLDLKIRRGADPAEVGAPFCRSGALTARLRAMDYHCYLSGVAVRSVGGWKARYRALPESERDCFAYMVRDALTVYEREYATSSTGETFTLDEMETFREKARNDTLHYPSPCPGYIVKTLDWLRDEVDAPTEPPARQERLNWWFQSESVYEESVVGRCCYEHDGNRCPYLAMKNQSVCDLHVKVRRALDDPDQTISEPQRKVTCR